MLLTEMNIFIEVSSEIALKCLSVLENFTIRKAHLKNRKNISSNLSFICKNIISTKFYLNEIVLYVVESKMKSTGYNLCNKPIIVHYKKIEKIKTSIASFYLNI